jgi:hypothetical protein
MKYNSTECAYRDCGSVTVGVFCFLRGVEIWSTRRYRRTFNRTFYSVEEKNPAYDGCSKCTTR